MRKGTFTISIDTELLWGRKDLNYSSFITRTKKEREIITKLLSLFKKYKIPATWAIVGKLYEKGSDLWSGIDFIEEIKKEKIHELASHSYSHEDFLLISKGKAKEEFAKPKAKSFVFPRNHINYLDILQESGFKSFRGNDKSKIEMLVPRIPPTSIPKRINKLIEVPSSLYFVSARGAKKYIPANIRFIKCKLGIDRAIKNKEIFHLWFHPVDFADDSQKLFKEFEQILKYAAKQRRENKLQILTMDQIVKEFNLDNTD